METPKIYQGFKVWVTMKYIGFKEPKNHWSIEDKHSNLRSTDHVTMPIYKSVSIDSLIVKVCALYKKSITYPRCR